MRFSHFLHSVQQSLTTSFPSRWQSNFVLNSFSHFNTVLWLAWLSLPHLLVDAILNVVWKMKYIIKGIKNSSKQRVSVNQILIQSSSATVKKFTQIRKSMSNWFENLASLKKLSFWIKNYSLNEIVLIQVKFNRNE